MKKLLLGLGTLTTLTIPVLSVVSCGSSNTQKNFLQIKWDNGSEFPLDQTLYIKKENIISFQIFFEGTNTFIEIKYGFGGSSEVINLSKEEVPNNKLWRRCFNFDEVLNQLNYWEEYKS